MDRLDLLTSGKILPIDGKIYWHVQNFTKNMDKFEVIFTFEKMFKILQPYFVPVFTSTADVNESQITLRFRVDGNEDLPEPFGSGTLAYAYLAQNTESKGLLSDVFFNDAYLWSAMHTQEGISLLKVSVHEVLHACGLHHSEDLTDILYPMYQANNDLVITQDTINAITRLYGTPKPDSDIYKYYRELFLTQKQLMKLTERQLLIIAGHIGIEANIDDLKANTAALILAKIMLK